MSNVTQLQNDERLEEVIRRVINRERQALPKDGGGGTYDGMERVAKLEARADGTDQRLGRIEDKLDRIADLIGGVNVELAKKPSTASLWVMVSSVLGVALVLAFGAFAIASYVVSIAPPS